jgi:hypothetical protein
MNILNSALAVVVARIRALPEPSPLRLCEALASQADALRLAGRPDDALSPAQESVALAERSDPAGRDGRSVAGRIALAQVLATHPEGREPARVLLCSAVDTPARVEGTEGPGARRAAAILAGLR